MKLTALPVHNFEDATLNFEQLQALDILSLTAEDVLQLPSPRALSLNCGAATATFAGSSTLQVTVAHGLGRTPIVAFGCNSDQGGGPSETAVWGYRVDLSGSTDAVFDGYIVNGFALSASVGFFWVAIG